MGMYRRAFSYIAISCLSVIMVLPLIWMLLSSLKTTDEIFQVPLTWIPKSFQWSNFTKALELAPFGLYISNSIITALCIVFLQIILSSMLAYALTQWKFKGKKLIFNSILVTYMLPSAATYVPSYVIVAKLQLLDTLTGIVISSMASVFAIFILHQAFLQIPKELIEAARSDGATDLMILTRIMMPMSKSTIFTVSLISFVQTYNSYLWPSLLINSEEKYLITVGLNRFFTTQGTFADQWPLIMAANVLAVVPLLLIFITFQKWFIKGISDNGLKG